MLMSIKYHPHKAWECSPTCGAAVVVIGKTVILAPALKAGTNPEMLH